MMNKNFIIVIAIMLIGFNGCDQARKAEPEAEVNKCTKYACPIHSDKTAPVLGNCPVCNKPMVLLPTDSLMNDSIKNK